MSHAVLLRGARQLVTLSGPPAPRRGKAMNEISIIPDGALLIIDGKIEQVGPSRRVERLNQAQDAEVIDATGHVVIPGFVDCHTRLLCGPPRSYEETDDPFTASCRAVRQYSAQRMELEGRKRLRQFVRTGTTTLLGACGYGLDESTELKALRVLKSLDERPLGLTPWYDGASRPAPDWERAPDDYLRWVQTELLPVIAHRKLSNGVTVSDRFTAPAVEEFIRAAREFGMKVRLQVRGEGGCLSLCGAVDAVTGLEETVDVAPAAQAPMVVITPGSVFQRGAHDFPPARQMVDAGAAVALATGYDHLDSATCSIPMVLALACAQMGLTPGEALVATTINAAAAMGLADVVGSFEVGKRADLLIMSCGDYRDIPLYFGMNLVTMVMRRGQQIYPMVEQT